MSFSGRALFAGDLVPLLIHDASAEIRIRIPRIVRRIDARIARVAHPFLHATAQLPSRGRVVRRVSDIHELRGVLAQIEEFLRRTLPEVQLEGTPHLRQLRAIEDEVLRLRPIHVAIVADGKPRLRIARRPAIGPQIPEIEKVPRADAADRIALMAAPHIGVALALDEDVIARDRRRLAEQHVEEAARRHLWRHLHSGGFEKSRREVREAHELLGPATRLQPRSPTDGQRHARARVVAIREAARHLPAIVAGENDERLVEQSRFLQLTNAAPGVHIDAPDSGVIGKHFARTTGSSGNSGGTVTVRASSPASASGSELHWCSAVSTFPLQKKKGFAGSRCAMKAAKSLCSRPTGFSVQPNSL
jgi:hypothetical protein